MSYSSSEEVEETEPDTPLVLTLGTREDIDPARRRISDLARSSGFADRTGDISLALTELCTNLFKYAGGGTVTTRLYPDSAHHGGKAPEDPGLEITVTDSGPGIYNVQRAFEDGFSSSNSRGSGLGKVNQAADEIDVTTGPEGTKFTFRVWSRSPDKGSDSTVPPLSFGFATRKHPAMEQNGDAFIHKLWDNRALIGVIDGVGHGGPAHEASSKAREYVENHYDVSLKSVLAGTNRACRGTRGAVAGLLRFHWDEEGADIEFAGVGNIECGMVADQEKEHLISMRGLLGSSFPVPRIEFREWTGKGPKTIFLHSDGIKSHWCFEDFEGIMEQSAPAMANRLLSELGRTNDDATIAIAKYVPGERDASP